MDSFLKKELEFQNMLNSGSPEYQTAYRELSASFASLDDQLRELDRRPDELVPARQVSGAIRAVMNFGTAMAQVQALAVNDDVVGMRQYVQRLGQDLSKLLAWVATAELQAQSAGASSESPKPATPAVADETTAPKPKKRAPKKKPPEAEG
jgi:hypothetical protein